MPEIRYTLHSVPQMLDEFLREQARRENKTLNAVLLENLERGKQAAVPDLHKHHDLDAFYGTWGDDEKFDEAMREFSEIDEEVWK